MNAEALAKRLAWSGAALSWLLNVAALIFMAVGTDVARPETYGPASSTAIDLLAAFIPPVVGAIIASHRPRNPIGWLLLAGALTSSFTSFAGEWSFYAFFVRPGSLFWADAAVIVTQTFWIANLTVLPLVALLFPSGSLLSPRWRLVAVTACAPVALALPLLVWAARSESGLELLQETAELDGVVDAALIASIVIALATLVAGVLSLLLRYLRGGPVLRRQIKWLVAAVAVLVVDGLTSTLLPVDAAWRQALSSFAFQLIPVALAIAVLRYRLYEIDRIISRTLAYGVLIAMLAGGYLVAVLALQSMLPVRDDSPVIVAASTLAVVAAFGPLRSRIRQLVDRRFNRSRYDAEHTIESFGARLRNEVELDALTAGLVTVVDRTMAPAHVSLWLRGERTG